jgi:hypothetical protein
MEASFTSRDLRKLGQVVGGPCLEVFANIMEKFLEQKAKKDEADKVDRIDKNKRILNKISKRKGDAKKVFLGKAKGMLEQAKATGKISKNSEYQGLWDTPITPSLEETSGGSSGQSPGGPSRSSTELAASPKMEAWQRRAAKAFASM